MSFRQRRQKVITDDPSEEIKGPLGGLSFVVSGVFENITREKLEAFVKKNGGKLQTGVTKSLDYLIVGKILDDNRPVTEGMKYKNAVNFGKKIMTEKEFEMFCKSRFDNPDFILGRKRIKDTTEDSYDYFAGSTEKDADMDKIDKL